jgi:parallel beta-helix repeat protein
MGGLKRSTGSLLIVLSVLSLFCISSNPAMAVSQSYLNIHINADGSISGVEGTHDVEKIGETYILRNSINGSIRIERSGITLDGCGYTIQKDGSGIGVSITSVTEVTVKNLQITDFSSGISSMDSYNNRVQDCKISDCTRAIRLSVYSRNNVFANNYLINNTIGVAFTYASDNVFTGNRLEANANPFHFEENWNNFIDPSNTVDGKPIYYFVGQKDLLVEPAGYPRIGYLAFVSCTRVTVKNLDLANSYTGMSLVYTNDSTVTMNTVRNNSKGITLVWSANNTITENQVSDNEYGIDVLSTIPNRIIRNNIANNKVGVNIDGANQVIYHNNFVNNERNANSNGWNTISSAPLPWGIHVWDNGYPSGGNYWSDYTGTDTNKDGIGDSPYILNGGSRNNSDRYPLVIPLDINQEIYTPVTPPPATATVAAVQSTPIEDEGVHLDSTTTFVLATLVIVGVTAVSLLLYKWTKRSKCFAV